MAPSPPFIAVPTMNQTLLPALLVSMACILSACSEAEDPEPPVPPTEELAYYYCSDRTGNFEIFLRTGDVDEQLTDDPLVDSWWPRASPDGSTVLFYRSDVADRPAVGGANNNYDFASLWMLDVATGVLTERIPLDANGWTTQGVADWSPDGTQIVMAAQSTPDGGRWHLFITDALGANPTRISTRTSLYLDPSWSPDGTKIVCVAHPVGVTGASLNDLEVFTMDVDGTNELRLTNDSFRDHDPYYSPDGNEIAFETDIDPTFFGVGRWGLRAVSTDGATLRTIIEDMQINTLPQYSFDGTVIYFQRFVFGGPGGFRLAQINVDGTGLEFITEGGAYDDTDFAHTNLMTLRTGGTLSQRDWFEFEFPEHVKPRNIDQAPGYYTQLPLSGR